MNIHTSFASVLALATFACPLVCHAQDPAAEYKNISALRAAKKYKEALELTDKVLSFFGNPSSRVGQQFKYFLPFFVWQKAETLAAMGEVDKAMEVYKDLNTNPAYKDAGMLEGSKVLPGWEADGYKPFLTLALFKMGYLRYQQAEGTPAAQGKPGTPGDPKKYEECIPLLEQYLAYLQGGKATEMEKAQGLDGRVCFMLMQANLLKENPDFDKVGEYLERGTHAKSSLPDTMVMNGLSKLMDLALEQTKYIGWGEKVVAAAPESFHMDADRLAVYGGKIFNYAINATKVADQALRDGNMEQAFAALRTANTLFGLVPDVAETKQALDEVVKMLGDLGKALPDKNAGRTYEAQPSKKLSETYAKMQSDRTELEAYIILSLANTAGQLGSPRMAKAGYKVLLDRYPELRQKQKDDFKELKDTNYLQYAQYARATGDEATATKYEGMVNTEKVDEGGKHAVVLNKMARLMREKAYEEVIPVTDEVMSLLSAEKGSQNYVMANFCKIAALFYLKRWEELVKVGEQFLADGLHQPKEGQLTEEQARTNGSQTMYFLLEAYRELAQKDIKLLDKALAVAENFMKTYPSLNEKENAMAPNIYFSAMNALLRRNGYGKEDAAAADKKKALEYSNVIAKNWPDNNLCPTARLIAGNILINGEEDAQKLEAIAVLEQAAEGALKQPEGAGKAVASNALFWLASYAPEFPREGEKEEDVQKRVHGYFNTFWEKADGEGNAFALQMAALELMRAVNAKDAAAYEVSLKRAREVIAREANYGFKNNQQNLELEPCINSYIASYVDGEKSLHGKELTLEEKTEHFTNFPGVAREDKYTNAILRMALLSSMNESLSAARRDGNKERAKQIEQDIQNAFGEMRKSFRPDDLTNFICVQVGRFEVDYAARFRPGSEDRKGEIEQALAYFNKVLERGKDYIKEATLGKANAFALSDDANQQKEARDLYSKLAASTDPAVAADALVGLTNLNMSTGNYKAAVESADRFMNIRGGTSPRARMDMQLKLGEAYCASGDVLKGLQTYMNLYVQNRGNITYSAPAVKAMMQQLWKRNNPSTGEHMKGNFKPSDRWSAWNTGQNYVNQLRRAGIDKKMTSGERDLFNEVVILADEYGKDPAVQKEEKEKNDFQSQLTK